VTDPFFLSVDDVLSLHADQLERYGGLPGVRDAGALEAAVETPRATFGGEYLHSDLFSMAAAYAFHIAESQAFVDETGRRILLLSEPMLLVARFYIEASCLAGSRGRVRVPDACRASLAATDRAGLLR